MSYSDYSRDFVRLMLIHDGVPADKLDENDPLFVWICERVERLLQQGAAYGDAYAIVMSKVMSDIEARQ